MDVELTRYVSRYRIKYKDGGAISSNKCPNSLKEIIK